jgi:hypothetical protein
MTGRAVCCHRVARLKHHFIASGKQRPERMTTGRHGLSREFETASHQRFVDWDHIWFHCAIVQRLLT